ncbi:MAG: hypothetical protein Q8O39_01765 [bacterium]|nr:hypothetical protein [bacterium]
MKTIRVSEENFKEMQWLYKEFYEIYGYEGETVWSLDDLDELRKIGQEFMEIFIISLSKNKEYAKTFFNFK